MNVGLSRDAAWINRVVNDPEVRPYVGPVELGELDFTALVAAEENLFPMGEHGGFALLWTAPKTLEVHTFVLPSGRGEWARQAASEGIEIARQSGAERLWTRIPPDRPNVKLYARAMGMKPTGEVIQTFGKPYRIFSMEINSCQ
jgi:hypothetical protein